MKIDRMSKVVVLAAACIAGLAACDRARDLSDVQLTQLLRAERASAQDPRAPLDSSAVFWVATTVTVGFPVSTVRS